MSDKSSLFGDQIVRYGIVNEAWENYDNRLLQIVETLRPRRVCEIGGGANPSFGLDVASRFGFEYTVLDVSQEELDKAPAGYNKVVCDIAAANLRLKPGYDFMFSRMLCEHIPDGQQFHRNVFSLLSPGGIAIHFMPTLFSLPFVANRIAPERLSSAVLDALLPRDRYQRGKFPAYYSWCLGPTSGMCSRFREIGYDILEYRGFFGHGYYQRLRPLHALQGWASRMLLRHPVPLLTSYAWITLQRPVPSH